LFEHDLFRKPASTFRDHALAAETIIGAEQHLVEVTPDKLAERRSSVDAATFEAAGDVERTECVDVGNVG
jgi:hypothetical protein